MKNLDKNEFQINTKTYKLGYKMYSKNELFAYKGVYAFVIECRLNQDIV